MIVTGVCVWCRATYRFTFAPTTKFSIEGRMCNHCGRDIQKRAKKGRFYISTAKP